MTYASPAPPSSLINPMITPLLSVTVPSSAMVVRWPWWPLTMMSPGILRWGRRQEETEMEPAAGSKWPRDFSQTSGRKKSPSGWLWYYSPGILTVLYNKIVFVAPDTVNCLSFEAHCVKSGGQNLRGCEFQKAASFSAEGVFHDHNLVLLAVLHQYL